MDASSRQTVPCVVGFRCIIHTQNLRLLYKGSVHIGQSCLGQDFLCLQGVWLTTMFSATTAAMKKERERCKRAREQQKRKRSTEPKAKNPRTKSPRNRPM